MSYIYWSGMTYDDYLAHHGILGQKWGRRRFQNPDGTLTPEGRKRYGRGDSASSKIKSGIASGAKAAGRAIASGAAVVGRTAGKAGSRLGEGVARGVKTKLAEKMPFMLNDEELVKYRERLNLENSYRQTQANKRDLKRKNQGDQFVKNLAKDVISSSAKTVANKAVSKWIDEKLKDDDDRRKEQIGLEMLEYNLSKNKAESAANELKADLHNDVRAQDKDENRKHDLRRNAQKADESINKAEEGIRRAQQAIDDFDNDIANRARTADDTFASTVRTNRENLVRNLDAAKAVRDAAKKNRENIDREIETLNRITEERAESMKRRRDLYDNILNQQKINSIEDFMRTLGKDKAKKNDALREYINNVLTDEERRELGLTRIGDG